MKTFQTVGMELATWGLVDQLMREKSLTLGDALERLVRNGDLRLQELERLVVS
jgi:hypothetical protein